MDVENKKITKDETFMVVYDFLKRNLILGKFVEESYRYHHNRGFLRNVKRITADVTRKIIKNNVELFYKSSFNNNRLTEIFIAYDGSFDWSNTKEGQQFWKQHLDYDWKAYVCERYGTHLVYIT